MAIPAGFFQHPSGMWMKTADSSGPYFFDGTNMVAVDVSAVYPIGATPAQSSSGNVAAATATATLAAAVGKTTYITGFIITGSGATAASVVSATVAGTVGGTQTYTFPVVAGAAAGNAPLIVTFPLPVPSSAVNTAIVVTLPSLGAGNTNATASAFGFQL